ncbi:MAG: endonuclease Q family protein [Nanoarchaeota archaeon]|nr:endonuclease Q family protein [Nanoarchaeota archaeon]MBU4493335.1 endonuclease Q family protein [Nanoarchaeota archaeon]
MRIIADLHIHSKHSRATSKQLNIQNLEKYARIKGLNLLGTGDFTHPIWIKELKSELIEDGTGILKTKTGFNFILQTEISLMYTQDGKGRKIHNVILAKNFDIVEQITEQLKKIGRVDYDGRPIFGIKCPEFVEMMKEIDKDIEIIPAHVWTPWFSLFGSNSGFDSVEQCFKDQTKHIHALETGLSSDPAMNWRLSMLDKYTLVSNSDLHSFWPWRIGRECNIFDLKELSYDLLLNAIRTKQGLVETIEVDPSYGKYHFDGHRNCNVCMSPNESLKNKDICPVCGRKLTIGVLHRVEELADRPAGFKPKDAVPFKKLIPLSEILSKLLNSGVASQKIWKAYYNLVNESRPEIDILLNLPLDKLKKITNEKIAEAIINIRNGKIKIQPGFDGEYGYPLFSDKDVKEEVVELKQVSKNKQKGLNEFI